MNKGLRLFLLAAMSAGLSCFSRPPEHINLGVCLHKMENLGIHITDSVYVGNIVTPEATYRVKITEHDRTVVEIFSAESKDKPLCRGEFTRYYERYHPYKDPFAPPNSFFSWFYEPAGGPVIKGKGGEYVYIPRFLTYESPEAQQRFADEQEIILAPLHAKAEQQMEEAAKNFAITPDFVSPLHEAYWDEFAKYRRLDERFSLDLLDLARTSIINDEHLVDRATRYYKSNCNEWQWEQDEEDLRRYPHVGSRCRYDFTHGETCKRLF